MNRTYVLTSDTPCQNPSSSWISAPEFLGPNAGMGNYRRQCNEPFWPIQDIVSRTCIAYPPVLPECVSPLTQISDFGSEP